MSNNEAKIKLRAVVSGETTVTRSADPKERWDGDDTHTEWRVENVLEVPMTGVDTWGWKRESSTFVVPEDWKNKNLYLVWLTYSTGDSFSHSSNGQAEVCALYDSFELAQEARKIILQDYEKNPNYDHKADSLLKLPGGEGVRPNAWKGYFERLESVNIDTVRVGCEGSSLRGLKYQ